MNEERTRFLPAAIALLLAALWSGCAASNGAVTFEATRAGEIMTRLRSRHGGTEQFRRFAGVAFSYRARFRDQERRFDTVGFRFGDWNHLWIRTAPEAETVLVGLGESAQALRGRPIATITTAAATPDGLVRLSGARGLESPEGPVKRELFTDPELDLALRSLPFLLEPSLTTSTGRWWYRTLIAPGHAAEELGRVEVEPGPSCSIDGTYLLEADARTGLLSHILYRGTHRVIRGRTQLVTLDDYASVQGIEVARRRVHRRPVDAKERQLTRNPFVDPPPAREETFLEERLDAIRFLTPAEADELLPLPIDERRVVDRRPSGSSEEHPPDERSRAELRPPGHLPLWVR